jgi:hypothetical protein
MSTSQADLNGMFARLQGTASRNGADILSWSFHKGSRTYGKSYTIQSDLDATNFGSYIVALGVTAAEAYTRMHAMCIALESVEAWKRQTERS